MSETHAESAAPPIAVPTSRRKVVKLSPWQWARANLFSSPLDVFLTVAVVALLAYVIPPVLRWTVLDASWHGQTRADCTGEGACWVFVKTHIMQFLYGFYPDGQHWRINLAGSILAVWGAASRFLPAQRARHVAAATLLCVYPFIAFTLLSGGVFGLEHVETTRWGGLTLTLVVALTGITGSLPLGVLLALGRRSNMVIVRRLCVAFIELWRGVPLITVLFMASVMLPLFLPGGITVDKLVRALVGVTLFSAAYMAEVVRGGLAAIPKGQYEAAAALGLGYWKTTGLIVLPQAMRLVIPGIVNTFIGLFKDTTLVLVVGMFDLLGIVQTASTDAEWLGLSLEGYAFAGTIFWLFCFGMSRYSARLERRLAVGRRA
jgi:general L-amino acid transport system permease protein